jgi:ferric-dicitrate binding protein FerR (iron transport regulator)
VAAGLKIRASRHGKRIRVSVTAIHTLNGSVAVRIRATPRHGRALTVRASLALKAGRRTQDLKLPARALAWRRLAVSVSYAGSRVVAPATATAKTLTR